MDGTQPATEALFYKTPYQTEAVASLDEVARDEKENLFVVFGATLFYPQGGGQKGDRGKIVLADDLDVPVLDTRKNLGSIRHYVEADSAAEDALRDVRSGTAVTHVVDWGLRYHQMRIHTVGHLLHCFLEEVKGEKLPDPVRSPLSDTGGENHYGFADRFDADDLRDATRLLNSFTSERHSIQTEADPTTPTFRWWHCEGWKIPCGGVHPEDVNEVELVEAEMTTKKQRSSRVIFRFATQ